MKLKSRKLLSAAIGVATVSYVVACGDARTGTETSGNLPAPPPGGAGGTSGAGGTGGVSGFPIVGNLPSPPPYAGFGGIPNTAGTNTGGAGGATPQVDGGGTDIADAATDGGADAASPTDAASLSDAGD